ncbi:MAG: hypothetical protein HRT66_00925 [Flavobacteriaceae bacterium]|nr:hypothetical protein [Flavobacteriaceae bacterium]
MKNVIKVIFLLVISVKGYSQSFDLAPFVLAGDDTSKLLGSYTSPMSKSLMYGLNGGWYTTAKVHKKLGFDLTFGVNIANAPNSDKTFIFNNDDYKFLSADIDGSKFETILGSDKTNVLNVKLEFDQEFADELGIPQNVFDELKKNGGIPTVTTEIDMPGGVAGDLPVAGIPVPMAQIGIGVVYNTDIIIRYMPTIGDEYSVGLWGIGIKHDILQHFGFVDKVPFLNVSVLAAMTNLTFEADLEDSDEAAGSDQKFEMTTKAYTVQLLASINIPVISVYVGVGYAGGTTDFALKGTYETAYYLDNPLTNVEEKYSTTATDPVSFSSDISGMRATVGARLALGPIKFFGDYTMQEYNTVTVGMSISIR